MTNLKDINGLAIQKFIQLHHHHVESLQRERTRRKQALSAGEYEEAYRKVFSEFQDYLGTPVDTSLDELEHGLKPRCLK